MHVIRNPPRATDAGFTLIELLISITILALVMAPLSNAIIGVLKNADATSARLVASHSAQISATYFAQDVQTMGVHDYSAVNAPIKTSVLLSGDAGSTCGPGGTASTVRFLSDTYDNAAPPALHSTVVSWALVAAAGDNQLIRTRCIDGSVASQTMVAHYLSGPPTVACSSSCNAGYSSPTPAVVPQTVTISFTVAAPKAAPPTYAVSLTGDRRQT